VASLLDLADPLVKKHDSTGLLAVITGALKSLFTKQESQPEQYIANVLRREARQLIVAVDNVERMYESDRVYRTLQLAHFLKQSKDVTYIFVAEKERLLKCVPPHHEGHSTEYIEKFIEYELYVPSPQMNDLRAYLNGLFTEKDEYIPKDFSIETSNNLIEDSATYRGILRTFNQFIFELSRRFFKDGDYTVKPEDKFTLDHIEIKYPALWLHIQANRSLYVGKLHDENWSMMRGFSDQKEQLKDDKERINTILDQMELDTARRKLVADILCDLFPNVKYALSGTKQAEEYTKWITNHEVAHPDVLDVYFASSEPHEVYQRNLAAIKETIDQLGTANETRQIELFRNYLESNRTESNSDHMLLLKQELFSKVTDRTKLRQYLRSLLRGYYGYAGYVSSQNEDGGRLARIIGSINSYGEFYLDKVPELDKHLRYIFEDTEKYLPHPTVLLRLGLFLLPERGNHFLAFDTWTSYGWLRNKILRYTDSYYRDSSATYTIFSESRDKEWRFVFYQWALCIRTDSQQRTPFRGSVTRKKRVNDYIFNILNNDHKLAYKMLREDLWYKQWQSDFAASWHVDSEKLAPYDKNMLVELVTKLTRSANLSQSKKTEMQALMNALIT
jgi:hypothetical protein